MAAFELCGLRQKLLLFVRRETGTFYAIDWGGTNFRTACITLSKKPHKVVRARLCMLTSVLDVVLTARRSSTGSTPIHALLPHPVS